MENMMTQEFAWPQGLLRQMEHCFNTDFSAVRLFITELPLALGVQAFTDGNHIYIAPAYYQPNTLRGRWLIAHELAHIMQQRQGRVFPLHKPGIITSKYLEQEANFNGLLAALGYQVPMAKYKSLFSVTIPGTAIQCGSIEEERWEEGSSEDDEKPKTKEEFQNIAGLIYRLYTKLKQIKITNESIIARIAKFEASIEKLPNENVTDQEKVPILKMTSPLDWFAYSVAMRKVLNERWKKEKQGRIGGYDFEFDVWSNPTHNRIPVRRIQLGNGKNKVLLLDPATGKARGYRDIAYDLYNMAKILGANILAKKNLPHKDSRQSEQVGEQILATALLYIYLGRGDQVKKLLASYLEPQTMQRLEQLFLEYIGLTFGFEADRFLYTSLDNLIHLANIANGHVFGRGPRQQRFSFLNVYSWVREIGGEYKHVYVPSEGENTKYHQNFLIRDLEDSLEKVDKQGNPKLLTSLGKALATSSGVFKKSKAFMKFANTETDMKMRLFGQLRRLKKGEDKTQLHEDRFELMGPLRIYVTIANLLRNMQISIGSENAAYATYATSSEVTLTIHYAEQLFEHTFLKMLLGEKPDQGPFQDLFPADEFQDVVNGILEKNEKKQKDFAKVAEVFALILGDNEINKLCEAILAEEDPSAKEGKKQALKEYVKKHNQLISDLFVNHSELVYEFLRQYAKACFSDGYSFLQKAMMIGHAGLVELLLYYGANLHYANKAATVHDVAMLHDLVYEVYRARRTSPKNITGIKTSNMCYSREWLLSDHIDGILEAFRQEQQKKDVTNLLVVPAENNCFTSGGCVKVINYLKKYWETLEKLDEGVLVIPIHWGLHWCTLVLHKPKGGDPIFYYFDSEGKKPAQQEFLISLLQASGIEGLKKMNFHDLSRSIQSDGYTCGTWASSVSKIIAALCLQGANHSDIEKMLDTEFTSLQQKIRQLHDSNWTKHTRGMANIVFQANDAELPSSKIEREENAEAKELLGKLRTFINKKFNVSSKNPVSVFKSVPSAQIQLAMQCLVAEYKGGEELLSKAIAMTSSEKWEFIQYLLPIINISGSVLAIIEQNLKLIKNSPIQQTILNQILHYYLGNPEPNSGQWLDAVTLQQELNDKLGNKMMDIGEDNDEDTKDCLLLQPYDLHDLEPERFIEELKNKNNKDKVVICPINLGLGNWALIAVFNGQGIFYYPDNYKKTQEIEKFALLLGRAINSDSKNINFADKALIPISYHADNAIHTGAHLIAAAPIIVEALEKGNGNVNNALKAESENIQKNAKNIYSKHEKTLNQRNKDLKEKLFKLSWQTDDDKWLDTSQVNRILYDFKTTQQKEGIKLLSAGTFGEQDLSDLKANIFDEFEKEDAKIIIAPVNCGNKHWCNLVIYKRKDGSPMVFFFDSKGNVPVNQALAKSAVELLEGRKGYQFISLSHLVQSNGYACGTWMIETEKWLTEQCLQQDQEENIVDIIKSAFKKEFIEKSQEEKINQQHELYLKNYPKQDQGFSGIEEERAKEIGDMKIKEIKRTENEKAFKLAQDLVKLLSGDLNNDLSNQLKAIYDKLNSLEPAQKDLVIYYCYYTLCANKISPFDIAIQLADINLFKDFFSRMEHDPNLKISGQNKTLIELVFAALKKYPNNKNLKLIAQQVWHGFCRQPQYQTQDIRNILMQEFGNEDKITVLETYDCNSAPGKLFSDIEEHTENGIVICPILMQQGKWVFMVRFKDDNNNLIYFLAQESKLMKEENIKILYNFITTDIIKGNKPKENTSLIDLMVNIKEYIKAYKDKTLFTDKQTQFDPEEKAKAANKQTRFSPEEKAEAAKILQEKYFSAPPKQDSSALTFLETSIMDGTISFGDVSDSINQLTNLNWNPQTLWHQTDNFKQLKQTTLNAEGLIAGCKNFLNSLKSVDMPNVKVIGKETTSEKETRIRKIPLGNKIEEEEDTKATKRKKVAVDIEPAGIIDLSKPLTSVLPAKIKEDIDDAVDSQNFILWLVKVDEGYYLPVVYDKKDNSVHFWDICETEKNDGRKENLMRWLFGKVNDKIKIHDHSAETAELFKRMLDKKNSEHNTELVINVLFTCVGNFVKENGLQPKKTDNYFKTYVVPLSTEDEILKNFKSKIDQMLKSMGKGLLESDKNNCENTVGLVMKDKNELWEKTLYTIDNEQDGLAKKNKGSNKKSDSTTMILAKTTTHTYSATFIKWLIYIADAIEDTLNKAKTEENQKKLTCLQKMFTDLLKKPYASGLQEHTGISNERLLAALFEPAIEKPILLDVSQYKEKMYNATDSKKPYSSLEMLQKDNTNATNPDAFIALTNILDSIGKKIEVAEGKQSNNNGWNEEITKFYEKYGRIATQAAMSLVLQSGKTPLSYVKLAIALGHKQLLKDMLQGLNAKQFIELFDLPLARKSQLLIKSVVDLCINTMVKVKKKGDVEPMQLDEEELNYELAGDMESIIKILKDQLSIETPDVFKLDLAGGHIDCYYNMQTNKMYVEIIIGEQRYHSPICEQFMQALFKQATGKDFALTNENPNTNSLVTTSQNRLTSI